MILDLETRLSSCTGFITNEYLTKYCQIIERNKRRHRTGSTNAHHIIPKFWFKMMRQSVDNTLSNLVNLEYREHVLAHYYLCLCTTDKLQFANELALICLSTRKKLNPSEKQLVQQLPLYNNIYENYLDHKRSKIDLSGEKD